MISKPPQNWSEENKAVSAAQSAVAVAQYATSATKRGYYLLKESASDCLPCSGDLPAPHSF